MRIVVNDIAASSGGALTVLESFYRYVRDSGGDHEWIFLLGSDLLEESDTIRTIILPGVKRSWLKRLAFDLVSGRRLIESLKPDVVLSLQNTCTYGVGCPQVVYVHQSLPFQRSRNFSVLRRNERTLATYQHIIGAVIKQSIRRADRIIVQAEWMRAAIIAQIGIDSHRVYSIPPDIDDLSAYASAGRLNAGSFSYPTSDHSYKNNECIYAACKLLREKHMYDFEVTMTIDGPPPDPNVRPIGRVPREQVLDLLSRTTLIFPSLIESSGLPPAEARALGTLVLAADLPHAREVLDRYPNAYYFDPSSPSQLAALMTQVISGTIVKVPTTDHSWASNRPTRTAAWARVVRVLEDRVAKEQAGQ